MNTFPKKLLVVIGEAALERLLVRDVKHFGAHGYTIADVRGGGEHGTRDAEWEGNRSIRLEVICEADAADRIAEHVMAHYAAHYSVSLYFADVAVIRSDKY